jgi:hypothetical protein
MALILCSALITGAMAAAGFIAAVTGPLDDSAQCNVSIYGVSSGAGSLVQTFPALWNSSAIAFDSNENIFVGEETAAWSGWYQITEHAYQPGTHNWNPTGTRVCLVESGYGLGHGMAVDKSGNIYLSVIDWSTPAWIYRYTPSTGFCNLWQTGPAPSGYAATGDLRIDPSGTNLWVSEAMKGMYNFNLATGANSYQAYTSDWPNMYGFDINPANGKIYAGGLYEGWTGVVVFSSAGGTTYAASRIFSPQPDPKLNNPRSLVFGPDWNGDGVQDYYVADVTNANIQVIDPTKAVNFSTTPDNWLGTITTSAPANCIASFVSPALVVDVATPYIASGADLTLWSVKVDVIDSTGTTVATKTISATQTIATNLYEFDFAALAAGTYTVRGYAPRFLNQSVSATVTTGGSTSVALTLVNGDLNGDNFVEDQDYSIMGVGWYQGGD